MIGEQSVRPGGEAGQGHLNLAAGVQDIRSDRDAITDQFLTVDGDTGLVVGAV